MQGLVTVFGGSGFVGRQVVRALVKRGLRIRVAVRRPNLAERMRILGDVGQIQITQANIRYPDSVARALDGAEACVNLPAVLYETGRQRFQSLHAMGAENVAKACAERGVRRLVQMSALGADANSSSKYARTKALGEQAARRHVPSATVVRPSLIFGQEDRLFNRFGSMAALSPFMALPGGGHTRFQPVFVGDVGQAIGTMVAGETSMGQTYELGGPDVVTFRELMELALRETCRKRALIPLPWPAASAIGVAGDIQARILPFPPVLTSDQVKLLKADNVVSQGALGLKDLGVEPTAMEAILPTYLYRYRPGGQFAEAPPQVWGGAA